MSETVLYLIRHGKSNASYLPTPIRQYPSSPLSPTGVSQARMAGQELRPHKIEVLLTSPLTRAKETAEIVSDHVGPFPIVHEGLRELDRPEIVYGLPTNSFANILYKTSLKESVTSHNLSWRLESDYDVWQLMLNTLNKPDYVPPYLSETWWELYERACSVSEDILSTYEGKRVAIISHSNFLAFFMTSLQLGRNAYAAQIFARSRANFLKHGELAILKQRPKWEIKRLDQHKTDQ